MIDSASHGNSTLLSALEAAVSAGDRALAEQVEREILQGLTRQAADARETELRVAALMAQLEFQGRPPAARFLGPEPATTVVRSRAARGAMPGMRLDRAAPKGFVYPVWFATNRQFSANAFGRERCGRTTYGRAEVFIPTSHRFGETGTSFLRRLLALDLQDDSVRLQRIDVQDNATFLGEVNRAVKEAPVDPAETQALVYLHGFNNSFESAAIRAAQIGYDLKVQGVTACFAWPSQASVAGYLPDSAAIEASERPIADFLAEFVAGCGASTVHVVAHSMGNRGLMRALQRLLQQGSGQVRFGQIFLAAPDVDRDLFLDFAGLYRSFAQRVTLYASRADLAVHLSARLHNAPRAGYFEPYTIAAGIDTVAVPDFDVDLLGHSYFARASALLHDIFDLIGNDQPPARRQRLVHAEVENVWRFME